MSKRILFVPALLLALTLGANAQDLMPAPPSGPVSAADPAVFDTSYRPSPTVSAHIQRRFLDRIRWSAGAAARDNLLAAFAERSPTEIWHELVVADGLTINNVADALTAYWVLNWVVANGAYSLEIDRAPIRRQLRIAFAQDPNFATMGDQQRQEAAEGYMLDFLVEHAALNTALEQGDAAALNRLAQVAAARFRQRMNVDLLAVAPGPEGFQPRVTSPD